MVSRTGDGSGSPPGVKPGALTDLLRQVAATPEGREAEPPPLLHGAVVGRFEIVRELGRGAFGVVYEAKDRELGRQVALKMVRPGTAAVEHGKVVREAEAIARLAHPNLVTLHDVGQSDGGPYLVFELLRGKTLQERIDDGPLPVQEAVHIAVEVARGLAHAHAEGVVHRDLKPANVFVTTKGQVKILDFGMAHAFGRRRLSGGTPAYMAPEQWEDDPEDERTDVFALGVMLHRMLSGEYPFPEGEGRWSADPTTAPKLDVPGAPELADLVDKMLDRTPKGRPRDGAAVLAALTPVEEALRAKPSDASPPTHAIRRKATLSDLFAEMKRRRVFRALLGYGIFAFTILQVVEPVMHGLRLPDWVLTAVVIALGAGLPVTVLLSWAYDLKGTTIVRAMPQGEKGTIRRAPWRLAGLVSAGAVLGAGLSWLALRQVSPPAPGVGADGPIHVAVADVVNETGEKELDVLSGLLVTSLEQSRRLSVMTQARVLDLAIRAGRKDVTRVDETIGREVGKANGVRALLLPAIRRLGSTYSLEMRAIDPVRDQHLFTVSDRATSKEALLDLLDRLSAQTRTRLGEDAEVQGSSRVSLGEAMTRSVEAYQHYLAGLEAWHRDGVRAVGLREFTEALRLDPGFAAAHGELADLLHFSYQQPERAAPHWLAADEGLEQMPEKERLLYRLKRAHRDPSLRHVSREDALRLGGEILGRFPDDKLAVTSAADAFETFDMPERMEPALRRALDLDPGYFWAAALLVDYLGNRTAEALELAQRAVATRRTPANLSILAGALRAVGDDRGATATAREVLRVDGGMNSLLAERACDTLLQLGSDEACLPIWRRMAAGGQNEFERDFGRFQLGFALLYRGQVQEALRLLEPGDGRPEATPRLLWQAYSVGRPRLDSPRAIEVVRRITNPQFRRNGLSFLGALEEAGRITDSLGGRGYEIVDRVNSYYGLVQRGRLEEALQVIRTVQADIHRRNVAGSLFGVALLEAEALFAAGRLGDAAAVWPEPLPCRCFDRFDYAQQYPRLALLRARAMEKLGRRADALKELDGILAFWKEADQDLPLLIEARAMRRRLSAEPAAPPAAATTLSDKP